MGNKVHPRSFRLALTNTWKSKWFNAKSYSAFLEQDVRIRKYLAHRLREAGVANIEVERSGVDMTVNLYTSKPGIVIGRGGAGADDLKRELKKKFFKGKSKLNLNIHEVSKPFTFAPLICQNIIEQLEKRIPFRRAAKRAIEQVMQSGVKGVKIIIAGRLNGAEIARSEKFMQGSIPLHTLRADIDYARGAAHTTYGAIGVKVWIYKGEVFKQEMDRTSDRTNE